MLLLKSPSSVEEAVHQRNFLAQTLAELLMSHGLLEPDDAVDGRSLVSRAKQLARSRRTSIELAIADKEPFATFRKHRYDTREVFPCLVMAFADGGSCIRSGYGWCPASKGMSLTHSNLASVNQGRIPGFSSVDERLSLSITNLDNAVSYGRGFPAMIAGGRSNPPYLAKVRIETPVVG